MKLPAGLQLFVHIDEQTDELRPSFDATVGAKSTSARHIFAMQNAEAFEVDKLDVETCHDEKWGICNRFRKRSGLKNGRDSAMHLSDLLIKLENFSLGPLVER